MSAPAEADCASGSDGAPTKAEKMRKYRKEREVAWTAEDRKEFNRKENERRKKNLVWPAAPLLFSLLVQLCSAGAPARTLYRSTAQKLQKERREAEAALRKASGGQARAQ